MAETSESLHILLVDDEQVIHDTLGDYLGELGHTVHNAYDGQEGVDAALSGDYHVALVDVRMPRVDGLALLAAVRESRPELAVVIITGHADMDMAIQALRLGAADFLPKPVKLLDLDVVLAKAQRLYELNRDRMHLREVVRGLQRSGDPETGRPRLVGESRAMAEVREQVRQAVEGGADSILITGETGTGKEVVARELHALHGDDSCPFIAVSCPSLPEQLVESELFGHVRGSFTGSTKDRAGAFELAHGGTLFLDEIGDLAPAAQASLLRVLETRSLRRVGGSREIDVDVRVVAATNADLESDDSDFRRDLLYRLNLFTIPLLPLRERPEDILPLAEHFLASYALRRNLEFAGFTPAARAALVAYAFPGNARELRNLVERAAILTRADTIDIEHLSVPPAPEADGTATMAAAAGDDGERARIIEALEETRWNRREAARRLGMPYSTLRYKLNRMDIR